MEERPHGNGKTPSSYLKQEVNLTNGTDGGLLYLLLIVRDHIHYSSVIKYAFLLSNLIFVNTLLTPTASSAKQ